MHHMPLDASDWSKSERVQAGMIVCSCSDAEHSI